MLRPRDNSRDEDPRRDAQRAQYKKQVGRLRLYLLLECAPLVVDPLEVADETFKQAFANPDVMYTYCDILRLADKVVEKYKRRKVARYSLEQIFDPYLEGLDPVREALRALDALSPGERGVIEGQILHLLTGEGMLDVVGGAASTKRGQKKKALAKLKKANVNLDVLKPFFAEMRGAQNERTNADQDQSRGAGMASR